MGARPTRLSNRRSRRCRDSPLLLRQPRAVLPQDAQAGRRLPLLSPRGDREELPVDDAAEAGNRALRRLVVGRGAARRRRCPRAAPGAGSGLAVPPARLLDHARYLRYGNLTRTGTPSHARTNGLEPIMAMVSW